MTDQDVINLLRQHLKPQEMPPEVRERIKQRVLAEVRAALGTHVTGTNQSSTSEAKTTAHQQSGVAG